MLNVVRYCFQKYQWLNKTCDITSIQSVYGGYTFRIELQNTQMNSGMSAKSWKSVCSGTIDPG